MRVTLFFVIALHASTAMGMNLFNSDRDDHRSLDVVIRRLEFGTDDDIKASLYHLRPMRARRGGEIKSGVVELGSPEETDLVIRQVGRAGTRVDLEDLTQSLAIRGLSWIYHFVVRFFNTVLPGLGTALPIIVALYLWVRYKDKVLAAVYSDASTKMPKEQRKAVFTSEIVSKDYQSKKKKGKL